MARAKDPIQLRANTAELFLLARIRDEAHRFAVTFHKKLRRRRTLRSALEDVPGVGARRQRELLRHFGSLKKVRAATAEALAQVPGMSASAAEAVVRYFTGPAAVENASEATPELDLPDVTEDAAASELAQLADAAGDGSEAPDYVSVDASTEKPSSSGT